MRNSCDPLTLKSKRSKQKLPHALPKNHLKEESSKNVKVIKLMARVMTRMATRTVIKKKATKKRRKRRIREKKWPTKPNSTWRANMITKEGALSSLPPTRNQTRISTVSSRKLKFIPLLAIQKEYKHYDFSRNMDICSYPDHWMARSNSGISAKKIVLSRLIVATHKVFGILSLIIPDVDSFLLATIGISCCGIQRLVKLFPNSQTKKSLIASNFPHWKINKIYSSVAVLIKKSFSLI
mmetsp:Transcript_34125/g.38762  ORF Transcript_34125/g.38762 Transcript_34125/m.38762 type:complete len:238 (-) Transcript_34125:606-1319(-)